MVLVHPTQRPVAQIGAKVLQTIRALQIGMKTPKDCRAGTVGDLPATGKKVWATSRQKLTIVSSDPDDDRILEAALAAGADYVVSGDHHLQDLGKWKSIQMVSPAEFMKRGKRGRSR